MNYKAPHGGTYPIYDSFLDAYNVLIAGTIGSGKSVFENGIMYSILNTNTPEEAHVYLIDPKKVELDGWRILPHVRDYADDADGAAAILDRIIDLMMERYKEMKAAGEKKYHGADIYVLVDEMADLMLADKKGFTARFQRIMQLGRAARIHLICCTQSASRVTIPAGVAIGFTCCVGLHAATRIESRQVIGMDGCEKLPLYGQAIIKWQNGTFEKVAVPMYSEAHYDGMKRYYMVQRFGTKSQGGM